MWRPDRMGGAHLSPERLAACEAGEGTLPERMHLRQCAACRDEVAAVGRVRALATAWRDAGGAHSGGAYADDASTEDAGADGAGTRARPLTSWETLAPQLRREGLLHDGARHHGVRHHSPRRAVARAPRVAGVALAAAAAVTLWLARGTPPGAREAGASSLPRMVAAEVGDGAVVPWVGDPAAFASHDPSPDTLARTRARLAALDRLLAASQAALASAPGDPVLLQSVQQAHAAREAALRQLGGTLPASHQLVRY
jgi:hypothetical protein